MRNMRWAIVIGLVALSGCGKPADPAQDGADSGTTTGGATAPAPSVAAGAAAPPPAFAVCRSCHAVEPGRNGVGPSLAGIVGTPAASRPGYAYSPALKASGLVWDRATLDKWLEGPTKLVPGTKMVIGVSNTAGRKAVIDYLESLK